MLRKPGKMRWAYSQPAGKLFVSDGKMLWLYTPDENRVERMKFKESDDMRAPLAFLLGKLDFDKEFRNLQSKTEGADTRIMAEPKTDNLPYSAVEFLVAPDSHIKEVKVTGFDRSILQFTFDQERVDPPLDGKLFQFSDAQRRGTGGIRAITQMADFVLKYADCARADPPAGGDGGVREGTARQVLPAGIPDLFDQGAVGRGGGRVVGLVRRAEEAQSGEVPDLQPAVRHADPRRPADSERARPAGRAPDRSQARAVHQGRPRRGPQRHAAVARPSGSRASFPKSTSPR